MADEDTQGTGTAGADGSADAGDGGSAIPAGDGTGTPSDSSASPGDTGAAGADGSDDSSGDQSGSQGDGSGDGGGKSDSQPEAFRTLAELDAQSSREDFSMNKTEARRVNVAMKHGFTTEEQIDEYIAKQDGKGGGKAKADGTDDKAGDDKAGDDSGKSSDDTQTDDGKEVDSQLLKVIAPHLDKSAETVDDAVKAIKNLQHEVSTRGEFINAAKEAGIKDVNDLKQTLGVLKNIDQDIEARLKDPQKLKEMYTAYKIPIPKFLENVAGANGSGQGADGSDSGASDSAVPADIEKLLSGIEDDGYIGAGDFKNKFLPALNTHYTSLIQKELKGMKDQFNEIGGFIQNQVKSTQAQTAVARSFEDARQISSHFGKFDESLILKTDPKVIWSQSVDAKGKVKEKPHAEFETLKKVFQLRKQAFDDAAATSKKTGQRIAPDVMGYLSKLFITSGGLNDIKDDASKKAAQKIVANLAKKLQPGVGKKKGAASEGFKVPQTITDVNKMSRRERQIFMKKLKTGELKVGMEA